MTDDKPSYTLKLPSYDTNESRWELVTASDIDRVFEEGMRFAKNSGSATVANPYASGTWEYSVFFLGVEKQIGIWFIDDLKETVAARKHATDRLERLQSLLSEIMATDEN